MLIGFGHVISFRYLTVGLTVRVQRTDPADARVRWNKVLSPRFNPTQPFIMRSVDLAHPALADLPDDAIVAKGATDEVSHCLGSWGNGSAESGGPFH
jgi:hypothetical protein